MLSPQYYTISLPLIRRRGGRCKHPHHPSTPLPPLRGSSMTGDCQQERFLSSRLLGLVVKSVPGIIIVGREHMPVPEAAGEVVMAVEVPVAADLNEPGATAGATGHIAGDGDHRATPMLPAFAFAFAGLPGL